MSPLPPPPEQGQRVRDATREQMREGETWALVSAKWWAGFRAHTDEGGPPPGPVDNDGLADGEPVGGHYELRMDLAENRDYAVITAEAWDLVREWYGGGPEFRRQVVAVGVQREARLDLFPLVLTVEWAEAKARQGEEDGPGGENDESDGNAAAGDDDDDEAEPGAAAFAAAGPAEFVRMSRKDTLADLAARLAASSAAVPEEKKEVVRRHSRVSAHADSSDWSSDDEDGVQVEGEGGGGGGEEGEAAAPAVRLWVADAAGAYSPVTGDDLLLPVDSFQFAHGARVRAERRLPDGSWPLRVAQRHWRDFRVADDVDALDTSHKWYESTIRDVKEGRVLVHFKGWAATWDEWIASDSDRLAELGTHTNGAYKGASSSRWGRLGNSSGSPHERGAVGLTNLGNTCFMNSTLQCLSNTPGLTDYFLSGDFRRDLNRENPLGWQGRVAEEYAALLRELWSGEYTSVTPSAFKQIIGEFQPRFSGYQQHDSSELLSFILDGLHEDLNRVRQKPATQGVESGGRDDAVVAAEAWETHLKRNKSVLVDTMQGQLKSRLVCPDCGRVSVTFDPFSFLSVPMPVEMDMSLTVAFVPRGGGPPTKFALTVLKEADTGDLKRAAAEAASARLERPVAPRDLLAADVFGSRVYRVLDDDSAVADLQANDHVYLYELPGLAGPHPERDEKEREEAAAAAAAAGGGGGGGGGEGFDPLDDDFYGPVRGGMSMTRVDEAGHADGLRPVLVVHQALKKNPYFGRYSNEREYLTENVGMPQILMMEPGATYGDLRRQVAALAEPYLREAGAAADSSDDDEEDAPAAAEAKADADPDDSGDDGRHAEPLYDIAVLDAHARGSGFLLTEEDADDKPIWGEAPKVGEAAAAGGGEAGEGEAAAEEVTGGGGGGLDRDSNYSDSDEEMYTSWRTGTTATRSGSKPGGSKRWTPIALGVRWRSPALYDTTLGDWDHMARDESVAELNRRAGEAAKSVALGDCLSLFTTEETLSEEDPWYCRVCKKHQRATKKFDLWRLPDVLVVHLKRFSFTRMWREKIGTAVDFPFEGLDLSEHCPNPEHHGALYDLYAVSNHFGGMGGGHYTAFARNPVNGRWYELDDSRVSEARPEEVRSAAAYVLFYVRRGAAGARASHEAAATSVAEEKQEE